MDLDRAVGRIADQVGFVPIGDPGAAQTNVAQLARVNVGNGVLEIFAAAFSFFSFGSRSLGASGRLTSLVFGGAHNNAILQLH